MKRLVSVMAILALVVTFSLPAGVAQAAWHKKNPCNPCGGKNKKWEHY